MTDSSAGPQPNDATRLLELFAAIRDDGASSDQWSEFEATLLQDAQAVDCYVRFMQLHVLLEERFNAGPAHRNPFDSPLPHEDASRHAAATISTLPGIPSNLLQGTVGFFSSGWPVAYLIATVILGFGLAIGAVTHVSQPVQVVSGYLPSPSGNGAGGEGSGRPDSPLHSIVGQITAAVECRLAADSKTKNPRPKTSVSLGDRFNLLSGLLEITYDTGARVILQGPVTYEVESPAGGFLSIGRLAARVENTESQDQRPKTEDPNPKSPNLQIFKFVVRTPTALVTDLGTEFGVEVGRAGLTHVHVFQGVVDAQVVNPRHGTESHRRLVEGDAVEIGRSSGNLQMIAFAPKLFTRKLQPVTDLSAEAAYIKAVLADKPMGYWPLNEPAGAREFLDRSGNDARGHMMGNLKAGQPGPLGGSSRAIELDGNGYVDLGRHDQFAVKNNFTVEAWLWIGAVKTRGMAFSVFGEGERPNGWTLMAGRLPPNGPAGLQFGINNVQDVSFPLPPDLAIENRWIHVAVSYDRNNSVWLFVNGVSYASAPVGTPVSVHPAWLAIGAAEQVGPAESINAARWRGRIAHVAVYAEELSVQQIQSHCRRRTDGREEAPDKHP
jgi:hypothetical protein